MNAIPGYRIQQQIHDGRNSRVYRAQRERDSLPVILKFLNDETPAAEKRARFQQEYSLSHQLRIGSVVRAYLLESSGGRQAMVLEDFGGTSLNKLALAGRLDLFDWLDLAIRIARALDELHAQNVMHKDINPSNIVWNRRTGELKLIDLGIASRLSRETPDAGSAERVEGTLPYVSPEQTGRMNRAVDYRTDLYSLGVTFYELLAGRLPFPDKDIAELLHAHLARMPMPPHAFNADIPPVLSAIVARLMEKNAEARYQSAAGVAADLRRCLDQLEETGAIESFPLGARDFPRRLQVSQQLYGRKEQVGQLLRACEDARAGQPRLVLVAGYSGVGKTALVHEAQRPIVAHGGHFIAGKFEQLRRDVPYAPLGQALGQLCRIILTQGVATVAAWRHRLLQALGGNGAVLTPVIPGLELIIGTSEPMPDLPAAQAQNRFKQAFRNLVACLASPEQPLALFLDDLQWADLQSLELVAWLLQTPAPMHLLIVGAYRDNEVGPGHALPLVLGEPALQGVAVDTIRLVPLTADDVARLLADTLRADADADAVRELAALCVAKTGGNPFFLSRFLIELADGKVLRLQPRTGAWEWSLQEVQQARITDNVVDLMVARLQRLAPATREVVETAACLGNAFELPTLALVCGLPEAQVAELLWPALQEDLVLPLDNRYRHAGSDVRGLAAGYRFLHDRVHQAACTLSEERRRAAIHLRIGRLWLASTPPERQEALLFDLVGQLNRGRCLVDDADERLHIARLNYTAGEKARRSAAYKAALAYFETALELMREPHWTSEYDFMLALRLAAAEAAYLNVDPERMEHHAGIALRHARGTLDAARVHEIRIQAYSSQGRYLESVRTGLDVLALLGCRFPAKPRKLHVLAAIVKGRLTLPRQRIKELMHQPPMSDPRALAVRRIITEITSAAYRVAPLYTPLLQYRSLELLFEHGNDPAAAYAYAAHAVFRSGMLGDTEVGAEYGDLALALESKTPLSPFKCRTNYLVHGLVKPWKTPLQQLLEPLMQDYLTGMAIGDMDFVTNAAVTYSVYGIYCGAPLRELEQKIAAHHAAMASMRAPLFRQKVVWQVVLNLLGEAPDPAVLRDRVFDAAQTAALEAVRDDRILMFQWYSQRMMLACLFHQPHEALRCSIEAKRLVETRMGVFTVTTWAFYDALARLAVYPEMDARARRAALRQVHARLKRLDCSPANTLHKRLLVQAELARCTGRADAADLYDQAIRAAQDNGYLNEEALARERAACFHAERGDTPRACEQMREAREAYARWGAQAKVADLEARHPHLLGDGFGADRLAPDQTVSITQASASGMLDTASIIRATQAISEEIQLGRLIQRLMEVANMNAGAQNGMLILKRGDAWFIEGEKTLQDAQARVMQGERLDDHSALRLPLSLIRYVSHARQPLVVHDARSDPLLAGDPYVDKARPFSALCLPILRHGELLGLLYLENNAVAGAFTERRLEVLQMIGAQAAISIENARLYAEMEERVNARTAELRALTLRDGLTGVGNRKAFDERIGEELARAGRSGRPLALLMIDIDHFKGINDAHGHLAGDECLRRLASALTTVRKRPSDFVARYGGEEFALLLPDTDREGALTVAQRVLEAARELEVELKTELGERRIGLTVSAGIAIAQAGLAPSARQLVAQADRRLYVAKQAGRDRAVADDDDAGLAQVHESLSG
ncbi:diguanylate cyclase [Oxalobacteraceae bacterium OM1]|nr:diguanylate cyclase [Oxalobacteraceae bacterium OM1]